MARLMEKLINEGKTDKAKKIIALALTKMPMDYYGYYTMVEPFASGYYELGEKAKAQRLFFKAPQQKLKERNLHIPRT